jgi:predicted nicotinamide N-methyase
LPSIAAALAGGRVIASDWSPDAVAFAARNAERNGAAVQTLVASWFEPAALLDHAPVDLVLGSDLLYERRNLPAMLDLLPELAGERGEVWIADPGRAIAETFLAQAAASFTIRSFPDPAGPRVQVHRLRPRR